MAYQNPYMDAMYKGGTLANQTANTAAQFGQNAIKAFDSSASIALKLDALLQEEMIHRDKMVVESQKQLMESFQHQQEMAFKEKDLDARQNRWGELNEQYRETQQINAQNRAEDLELKKRRWEVQDKQHNENLAIQNMNIENNYDKKNIDLLNLYLKNAKNAIKDQMAKEINAIKNNPDYVAVNAAGQKIVLDPIALQNEIDRITNTYNPQLSEIDSKYSQQLANIYKTQGNVTTGEEFFRSGVQQQSVQQPIISQTKQEENGVDLNQERRGLSENFMFKNNEVIRKPGKIDKHALEVMTAINGNIGINDATMKFIDDKVGIENISQDKISLYKQGKIGLMSLFGVDKIIESSTDNKDRVQDITTFSMLGLTSKNKKDRVETVHMLEKSLGRINGVGNNFIEIYNTLDKTTQDNIKKEIGKNSYLEERIKNAENPSTTISDETVNKFRQKGWLKDFLGVQTGDQRLDEMTNALQKADIEYMRKTGISMIGNSIKTAISMFGSKTGIFMSSYDVEGMTHEFGKQIANNKEFQEYVFHDADYVNKMKQAHNQKLKEYEPDVGYENWSNRANAYNELNKKTASFNPAEIVKTMSKEQKNRMDEFLASKARHYNAGYNKDPFNKVASAIYGMKYITAVNSRYTDQGVAKTVKEFTDALFN